MVFSQCRALTHLNTLDAWYRGQSIYMLMINALCWFFPLTLSESAVRGKIEALNTSSLLNCYINRNRVSEHSPRSAANQSCCLEKRRRPAPHGRYTRVILQRAHTNTYRERNTGHRTKGGGGKVTCTERKAWTMSALMELRGLSLITMKICSSFSRLMKLPNQDFLASLWRKEWTLSVGCISALISRGGAKGEELGQALRLQSKRDHSIKAKLE